MNPLLGRWVSADPLAVHSPGEADLNVYAYVEGGILADVDPLGLQGSKKLSAIRKSQTRQGAISGKDFRNAAIQHVVKEGVGAVADAVKSAAGPVLGTLIARVVDDKVAKLEQKVETAFPATDSAKTVVAVTTVAAGGHQLLKGAVKHGPAIAKRIVEKASAARKSMLNQLDDIGKNAKKGLDGPSATEGVLEVGCFVAGTLVWTASRLVAIEQIQPGDLVKSAPEVGGGEFSFREVLETYVREDVPVAHLELTDEGGASDGVGVTLNHPYWREGSGWTRVGDLVPGDRVWSVERGWLKISSIRLRHEREPVYNLNVSVDHTYVVGVLGAWVHNAPCGEGKKFPDGVPDEAVVCRGGSCTEKAFKHGNHDHTPDGKLEGASVGVGDTVEEASSGIPHDKVGVTTAKEVREAGGSLDNDHGTHAGMSGVSDADAAKLFKGTVQPNPSNPSKK